MGKANFTGDFKPDAVAQITERGYPVARVSKRLSVSQHSLYARKKKFSQPSGSRALMHVWYRQWKMEILE